MFIGAGVEAGVRYVCSGHRNYKNCQNKKTILKIRLEKQLIGSLVANLSQPSLRSEIHDVFRSQLATRWDDARRNSQNEKRKAELEARLQHLEVGNSNLLDAIEVAGPESELLKRLQSIKEERVIVQQQLAAYATLVCDPPTEEEISAFVDEKMNTLVAVLMSDEQKGTSGDPEAHLCSDHAASRDRQQILVEVSGDVSLFSSSDAMQDISRERSALHCIDYSLRFRAHDSPGESTRAQSEAKSIRAKRMHAN